MWPRNLMKFSMKYSENERMGTNLQFPKNNEVLSFKHNWLIWTWHQIAHSNKWLSFLCIFFLISFLASSMCDETHHIGDHWKKGCMDCSCLDNLSLMCSAPSCAPPLVHPLCHLAKRTPDECCSTKLVCEERKPSVVFKSF